MINCSIFIKDCCLMILTEETKRNSSEPRKTLLPKSSFSGQMPSYLLKKPQVFSIRVHYHRYLVFRNQ